MQDTDQNVKTNLYYSTWNFYYYGRLMILVNIIPLYWFLIVSGLKILKHNLKRSLSSICLLIYSTHISPHLMFIYNSHINLYINCSLVHLMLRKSVPLCLFICISNIHLIFIMVILYSSVNLNNIEIS